MGITAFSNSEEDRFKTVAEYKDCIARGGEVVFLWEQVEYGVGLADPPDTCKNPGEKAPPQYCVAYADGSHEKWYKTPEAVLQGTPASIIECSSILTVEILSDSTGLGVGFVIPRPCPTLPISGGNCTRLSSILLTSLS